MRYFKNSNRIFLLELERLFLRRFFCTIGMFLYSLVKDKLCAQMCLENNFDDKEM